MPERLVRFTPSFFDRLDDLLLDVVIINEEFRWWSLHELTSGTTAWNFEPSARVHSKFAT